MAKATDPAGNTDPTPASFTWTVVTAGPALPPDPSTVAPPLDGSVATALQTATAFLYSGPNPIQTGVADGTIERRRAAVLRGKVLARGGAPLTGAAITILDHPELGATTSRADGVFDLAVNGGGSLTVQYEKAGHLSAQRQVSVPWQDYAQVPDVVLIPLDSKVTPIALGPAASMQVARGSVQTDADGTRQATVFFPAGTTAGLVQPNGTALPVTTLNVRLTEYTVGPSGSQAMPAELPPTSAFTYAVELSADEAVAKVNGRDVIFNQPVFFYVENFLNIPVGKKVPVGYYDNTRGIWVPSPDGRVLKVLGTTAGLADLDVSGDGMADTGAALAQLGIVDAERQRLASLYPLGTSLWRAPLEHFSTRDLNWPYGCTTTDCDPPNPADPESDDSPDDSCGQDGSVIECESQILGETVSVSGTPFTLNYRSNRAPGRIAAYSLRIPLSRTAVRANLKRIELEVSVAGRHFVQSFPAAPNQGTSFTWDGKDAYGRTVLGRRPVCVRVGYVYQAVLLSAANVAQSFAALGLPESLAPARSEITLWKDWRSSLGAWDARAQGLGGWTLDVHHGYDPGSGALFLGDGSRRTTQSLPTILSKFAGGAFCGLGGCGDGGPAISAGLAVAQNIAVGPDGSVYIPSRDGQRVRRVGPDGIITTVAGTGTGGFSGDGGPAIQARLDSPEGVAVGPDGSLYVADTGNNRIRRVGLDGLTSTIAGDGTGDHSVEPLGDGGPAIQARVAQPAGIAVGLDGSVYIANPTHYGVRRVGTDGIITTVAGTGQRCDPPSAQCGDGGPARAARLFAPKGVAAGSDGGLFIADTGGNRIRHVSTDGTIRTIAGIGSYNGGFSGDGGPATQAELNVPSSVSVAPDGNLFISDTNNQRIRRVSTDGVISTVVGGGAPCGAAACGYGGPATQARLGGSGLSAHVAPDDALIIWDQGTFGVVRVAPLLGGMTAGDHVIAAEDGSEVFVFSSSGKHQQTRDALTGAIRCQFSYDNAGRLASVDDGDGNITTIQRDGVTGLPTAIVAPFGQRTAMALDANGFLIRITNPATEAVDLANTTTGLLLSFTDPRGGKYKFTYDVLGRLTRDEDPAGGIKNLSRTGTTTGYSVTVSTGLGRVTNYSVERLATGGTKRVVVTPSGARTESVRGTDGSMHTNYSDGTVDDVVLGPDPRWGMQAPIVSSFTRTTPGGLVQTLTGSRTVTLANAADLFSLTSQTEVLTINGRAWSSVYQAGSKTLTGTSPAGRQATATLDARGRALRSQAAGLEPRTYTYDARGRLQGISDGTGPAPRASQFTYGLDGLLASVTDPLGRTVTFSYDAVGRITQQTLPDRPGTTRTVGFVNDAGGNLSSLTPPGRTAHAFSYTPVNLEASYTPPSLAIGSAPTGYSYNADRQLTRVARPGGALVDLAYDAAGRLGSVTLPRGALAYTYDAASRLAGSGTPDALDLAYAYDGGLLTGSDASGPVSGNVSRTYDASFRPATLSVNGSNPVTFGYDADDLLVTAGVLKLSRDSQHGLLTGTVMGVVTDAWTYNDFAEPTAYSVSTSGTVRFNAQYTRDALGRISARTETFGAATDTYAYTYDPAGRLTNVQKNGASHAGYTYDSNSNRLTATDAAGMVSNSTYDAHDRLTQYGTSIYAYTAAGELQSKTFAGQTTTYSYDQLGNLLGVTLPNATTITYLIDGQNRRVGKRVNGALAQGFLYEDSLRPIAELDGTGAVVSRFVYATRINVPDYMVKGGVTYRLLTDHLGSPRLVIDIATGAFAQRMEYDSWGNVMADTNPGFQPFGFAGGLYDQDTGLVRFGARDYDAETGRWTVKDPVLFAGGQTNLYAYVAGDPINLTDPTGLTYLDFSFSFGSSFGPGFTFGVQVEDGRYHPYGGVGFSTRGVSFSANLAPGQSVTPGWNICIGANTSAVSPSPFGFAGQVGLGEGSPFWEMGLSFGKWGASVIGIYVF